MPRPPTSPSPPPATFAFVTGNFDYPRATGLPAPPPTRGPGVDEWLRILNRQGLEQLNRRDSPAANSDAMSLPRIPRALRRTLAGERETRDPNSQSEGLVIPSVNNRPRATPSSQRALRRSHARLREQREADMNRMDDVDDILDPATRRPRVFENPFSAAHSRLRSVADEPELPPRRTKRRKVDHDSTPEFRYGHKGQVVPGRLRMEIVSYDGGEYGNHNACGLYPIENVLKNDKSVYCSERPRCNLLLKHVGEAPFTLEKVVIRAPDRGFTAPVQEGLIFVAMSCDDIISGTSGYKIEYGSASPPVSPRLSPPSSVGDQLLSFQEAINDPHIWETYRQGVEALDIESLRLRSRRLRMEDATHSDREHQGGDLRSESAGSLYSQLAEICEDPPNDELPATAGVSAPTPPPFTVLTESEDETDDDEDLPSAAIMADRLRRESRWRDESEGEEEENLLSLPRRASRVSRVWDDASSRRSHFMQHLESIRATRRQSPSRIEPKDINSASEPVILPNAKFFIAKHKSKITIKFHPAISGKYVLLKLWSPTHDGNIDIESVQFFGYSGPRFFPAIQLC